MSSRTVRVDPDVYERLRGVQLPAESISEVIARLLRYQARHDPQCNPKTGCTCEVGCPVCTVLLDE